MNNEENISKEYPRCIFCGEPTIIAHVKDSHGGHEALVCSKCHKFQNSIAGQNKKSLED